MINSMIINFINQIKYYQLKLKIYATQIAQKQNIQNYFIMSGNNKNQQLNDKNFLNYSKQNSISPQESKIEIKDLNSQQSSNIVFKLNNLQYQKLMPNVSHFITDEEDSGYKKLILDQQTTKLEEYRMSLQKINGLNKKTIQKDQNVANIIRYQNSINTIKDKFLNNINSIKSWNYQNNNKNKQFFFKIEDTINQFEQQILKILQSYQGRAQWQSPVFSKDTSLIQSQNTNSKYRQQILNIIQHLNQKQQYIDFLQNQISSKDQLREAYMKFNSQQQINNSNKYIKQEQCYIKKQLRSPSSFFSSWKFPWQSNYKKIETIIKKQYEISQLSNHDNYSYRFKKNTMKQDDKRIRQFENDSQMDVKFEQQEISKNMMDKLNRLRLNSGILNLCLQVRKKSDEQIVNLEQIENNYKNLCKRYIECVNLIWMLLLKLNNQFKKSNIQWKYIKQIQYHLNSIKQQINYNIKLRIRLNSQSYIGERHNKHDVIAAIKQLTKQCDEGLSSIYQYNKTIYYLIKYDLSKY